jgi:serine/threonine-protein kinase RsbW
MTSDDSISCNDAFALFSKCEAFQRDCSSIPGIIHFIRDACEKELKLERNSALTGILEVAVTEGAINAIKYAIPPKSSTDEDTITLDLMIFSNRIEIRIVDHGPGFLINSVPIPDLECHPEHGYGIFIMKNVMDVVAYGASKTTNTLFILKYL